MYDEFIAAQITREINNPRVKMTALKISGIDPISCALARACAVNIGAPLGTAKRRKDQGARRRDPLFACTVSRIFRPSRE